MNAWAKGSCWKLKRGYNATIEDPGIYLDRQIIFGEEKFVVSNIGNGLRVGGAAEFAAVTAPPNYKRSARLVKNCQVLFARIEHPGIPTLDGSATLNAGLFTGNRCFTQV